MHSVQFLPADIELKVQPGTLISDAAIMAGIEDLHLPCAGKGTCGRCLVEVVSGNPIQTSTAHLDLALADRHLVMACQTKVNEDLVIRIPEQRETAMRVVGDSHFLVGEEYLPNRNALSSLYRIERLTVPPATIEEHYSDWQRLSHEIGAKVGSPNISTDVWVLRSLAEALRAKNGRVTVALQEDDCGYRVWNVAAGHGPMNVYGVAIDIGTTTIAVQLVNLNTGEVASSRTLYNAQISRGADVISRIDYAKNPVRQFELRELVLDTINELIAAVAEDVGLPPVEIRAAFVAGNTTMVHMLLALPPRFIRETPYVPTVNTVPTLFAPDVGLRIHSQAAIGFAPGVGSYVGGDITAGLLCTEIPKNHDEVFLFLDIGTNGEIVLGNADWMVACACSAGPAFEGSGIKCGTRATFGAIEYLEISEDAREVRYDVIGETKPAGICGSGLICLLGELLVRGVVDQSGHFNTEIDTDRIVPHGSSRAFVLEWGKNTESGEDLVITEPDIENLMRTKAAIYGACALILANVGLGWDAISRIYIAGGFGRYIQIEDAVMIGLLPDLPYDRFTYIGNSALTGAYTALLSREHRQLLGEIANKMTYIDLSSDPHYMDAYVSALFLPHTDLAQFPSVANRLTNLKSTI